MVAAMTSLSLVAMASCGTGTNNKDAASVDSTVVDENVESAVAFDFKYEGLNGEDVSLEKFTSHGKYVVLDFWGTWCPWCIKGIPEMKKYYAKYSDKMEIIGVNQGDSKYDLLMCAEKNNMNWTHVMNHDGAKDDLVSAYAVEGFPTKVIIDTDKRVVASYVGETQEFYDKLDELLK